MASPSDSNRDEPPKETIPEPKANPFIKFRRFADAKIGTLLQGIIGLPSVISNKTSENTRWADIDEDLRRRDELQSKQRQLRDGDTRRQRDEEAEIPVETSSTRGKNTSLGLGESSVYFPYNVTDGRDIPLYSPVTKAVFTQFGYGDSEVGWNKVQPITTLGDLFRMEYFPFHVMKNQKLLGGMEAFRYMAYNELNRSNTLRSDYSLLPYLLFSPYSPIRLSFEATKTWKVGSSFREFPYHAAFEDLIQTTMESQNQEEMGTKNPKLLGENPILKDYERDQDKVVTVRQDYGNAGMSRGPISRHPSSDVSFMPFRMHDLNHYQMGFAVGWMAWIHNLYGQDVLQQRQIMESSSLFNAFLPFPHPPQRQEANDEDDEKDKDAETEYDMYDRFLHWASNPSAIAGALDSLRSDTEGFIEKQLKALETPEGKRVVEDLMESKFAKEVKDLVAMLEGFDRSDKRPQTSTDAALKALQDPGKVVSTSTTTEHTTHEDGSVETCVTVWKRYADGRESVTTTNHVDNPACDENGNRIPTSDAEEAGESNEENKKQAKKGWFWN